MSFDDDPWKQALAGLKLKFPAIKGGDELAVMDIPEPAWLIEDILPQGLTILGGPKKLGKSYLVIQFAKQLVEDGYPVFYFAGEDTYEIHKQRQEQVGLEGTDKYQFVAGRQEHFSEPNKFFHCVSETLRNAPFKAVFIDVMEHCLKPAQIRDYSYYMTELGRWAKLAAKHKIALLMVTHNGKNAAQYYPDPLDHIIGSAGITAAADWILIMQKSQDGQAATLYSEGKMGAASEHSLKKKNGIFFEIDGLEKERLIQRKPAQNKIREYVIANPGAKQVDIAKALKMDAGNVSRDCGKLTGDNYIYLTDNGYFATPDNPDKFDKIDR